jgi:hypothetical protein
VGKFKAGFSGAIKMSTLPHVVSMSMICPVRLSQPTDSDTRFAQQ